MENIKYGNISKFKKGYHLSSELESMGFVLVKENTHPRGWTLARSFNQSYPMRDLHWSSSLKRLDKFISRHFYKLTGDENDR